MRHFSKFRLAYLLVPAVVLFGLVFALSRSMAPDIPSVIAQSGTPDIQWTDTWTATGVGSSGSHNVFPTTSGGRAITSWIVWYYTEGTPSVVSIQLEGATDAAGSPTGSYTALTAATTPIASANPASGTLQGIIRACCDYYPHIEMNLKTLTGGTKVTARVFGYTGVLAATGGGGGSSGGGTIAKTNNALRGDNAGNAIAVTGTATNCVHTDGTSAACPSGGGSLILVEAHTASASASLQFTSCISGTYDDYQLELVDMLPASSGQRLLLQVSTNGGSSYDGGSNYQWASAYTLGFAPVGGNQNNSADVGVQLGPGNLDSSTTWGGMSATLHLYGPASGSYTHLTGQSVAKDGGDAGLNGRAFAGMYLSQTAVNAFQVLMTGSVNLASGTVRCYGLAH